MHQQHAPGGYQPSHMGVDLNAAAKAAREALEKAKKAAVFQKQIAEQMKQLQQTGSLGFETQPKPRKLILDEFGRELDEDGNILPMKPKVISTLKVNVNKQAEKEMRLKEDKPTHTQFIDKGLKTAAEPKGRSRKLNFKFVSDGDYVKREERMLDRIEQKRLGIDMDAFQKQKKAEKDARAKEADFNPNDIKVAPRTFPVMQKLKKRDPVPDIEWWDKLLMVADQEEGAPPKLDEQKVTNFVEHPVPIVPSQKATKTETTMYLTVKERKKLRRLRRQNTMKEIQDKLKMGLLEPQAPKIKMSNLMRVLGDDQVANPSGVERKAKQAVAERKKGHEDRNEARKLTDEQRRAKKVQKWTEDTTHEAHALLFKVKDLANKRYLFKVDMNAQQFHLHGAALVLNDHWSVVAVEGGPRSVRRFRRLMTRRIKWGEDRAVDSDDSDDEGAVKVSDDCVLVWEGVVKKKFFTNWKVHQCRSDQEALKALRTTNAEHYWEMVERFRAQEQDI